MATALPGAFEGPHDGNKEIQPARESPQLSTDDDDDGSMDATSTPSSTPAALASSSTPPRLLLLLLLRLLAPCTCRCCLLRTCGSY